MKRFNIKSLINKKFKSFLSILGGGWLIYSIIKEAFHGRTYLGQIIKLCNLELKSIRLWYILYPVFLCIIILIIIIRRENNRFIDSSIVFRFNAHWVKNANKKFVDPNPLCSCCQPPKRLMLLGNGYFHGGGAEKQYPYFKFEEIKKIFLD